MAEAVVPKIKVQIATSELGSDNNDIKLSTSFELKVYGSNVEQNKLMGQIKNLIVDHNNKMQGVQTLFDRPDDEDFPSSKKAPAKKSKVAAKAIAH